MAGDVSLPVMTMCFLNYFFLSASSCPALLSSRCTPKSGYHPFLLRVVVFRYIYDITVFILSLSSSILASVYFLIIEILLIITIKFKINILKEVLKN